MMRYVGSVLISYWLAASLLLPAVAAQDKGGAQAPPEAGTGTIGTQNQKPPPRPRKPVTTFKPSEKIRADSAVSFPVDI
jgi:hypothetical protein